jgi:hypothetical protein
MTYNSQEHLHRFACWTAAAATRRGFVSNQIISNAIKKANLRELIDLDTLNKGDYQEIHEKKCDEIIEALMEEIEKSNSINKKSLSEKCTFGRAAKIVAIYAKTCVVLPRIHDSKYHDLISSIFPPIDSILIENLSRNDLLRQIKKFKWTKASKDEYNKLKQDIEEAGEPFNWKLEVNWEGHRDEE